MVIIFIFLRLSSVNAVLFKEPSMIFIPRNLAIPWIFVNGGEKENILT